MGQKTERIKELEGELAAERYFLRQIGDTLGVEFEPPTSTAEAQREHQRFLEALSRVKDGAVILGAGRLLAREPRRPRPAAPGSWDTHDEEVDDQIDRLEAQGLTRPRAPISRTADARALEEFEASILSPPRAMVRRNDSLPVDPIFDPTITSIANELGLNVEQMPLGEALSAIHEEIVRVKNQGADVEAESGSKFLSAGKSLGQAIAHDHAQAADLRDGVTQARTIVARLAAVMQIDKWDKDGTELLERAQRWEGWKHELKRRVRELRSTPPYATVTLAPDKPVGWVDVHKQIADELDRHLQRLLSTKEIADWLKATAGAVKVDAGPPVPPYPFEFTSIDVRLIGQAMEGESADPARGRSVMSDVERTDAIIKVFDQIDDSRVASEEFARTMNLVILPILARQRAAQKVPADAGFMMPAGRLGEGFEKP